LGDSGFMVNLADHIRTVPNFPIDGVQFRDVTSILEHPRAFEDSLRKLTSMCASANTIVGIESRGFVFGAPVANRLAVPFILARKPGKLPNDTVSKSYKLEYGAAELHIQTVSPIFGNVVIIDDLIATGGTALACADLIHERWNIPKERITICAVIDLPDLKGSAIIAEQGYNVKTLIEFEGE
jgi:adenine phosphoribosyltransferase